MFIGAILLAAALTSTSDASTVTSHAAVAADAVVDSMGVNVHLHYYDTVYGDFSLIKSLLSNLHVRHIRDGLTDTTWTPYYSRHTALGKLGIKSVFVTSPTESDGVLLDWPSRVNGEFEGYEAPNEWDANGGAGWAKTLATFTAHLYAVVKSSSATSSYPVIGPSLTSAQSYATLSATAKSRGINLSGACNYSNLHNYPGGRNPGTAGWSADGYGSIAYNLNLAHSIWPDKTAIATETGYYTLNQGQGIPEVIEALYVPRLVLEQYRNGIVRSYLYELIDESATFEGSEGRFGLARADGSIKPAFRSIQKLNAILSDQGSAFTTRPLLYSLVTKDSTIHQLLMQKRDGTYYLALWRERQLYDVNTQTQVALGTSTVELTFANTPKLLETFQFENNGDVATASVSAVSHLALQVSDAVLLLRIK